VDRFNSPKTLRDISFDWYHASKLVTFQSDLSRP